MVPAATSKTELYMFIVLSASFLSTSAFDVTLTEALSS